jgi:hypothetical protein
VAYEFGGTFNNHMLARLSAFLNNQQLALGGGAGGGGDILGRLAHLLAEQGRIGNLQISYDSGGNPTSCTYGPPSSYIGKLVAAYEILGGDPLFDLQVRQMSQSVFILPPAATLPAQQLSDGSILSQPGLMDAPSCSLVQQMKGPMQEVLQYKRENIERKVRRALDYSDQLGAEITDLIDYLNNDIGLQMLTGQVVTLLNDPMYRAIYNDVNNDIHGKFSHAPFLAYEPGPARTTFSNTGRIEGGINLAGNQASVLNQTPVTPPSTTSAVTPATGPSAGILPPGPPPTTP